MVDISATLVHFGHTRLLEKAKKLYGGENEVIVGLTTDQEVFDAKHYTPELTYEHRKEVLQALRSVDEVVPVPWQITQEILDKYQIDLLVHGDDNSNDVKDIKIFPRTEEISSTDLRKRAMAVLVDAKNNVKPMFTPGPSALSPQSILDIRPVFGRDDDEYALIASTVLENIRQLTGHQRIATFQGSGTTAIDIATSNFVLGNVLIIDSGYYSQRIIEIYKRKLGLLEKTKITVIPYNEISQECNNNRKFDWVVAVYSETVDSFLSDIHLLHQLAQSKSAKFYLDATASINLEPNHNLSDACSFSSCKGLMGITGAGFITFNESCLETNLKPQLSYCLDLDTFINHGTTGPYHALCSLYTISNNFGEINEKIKKSKNFFMQKYAEYVVQESMHQPLINTMIESQSIRYHRGVPYSPRTVTAGRSVICHLADAFSPNENIGKIYENIEIK